MSIKNLKQQGQAWGVTVATIVASIDGVEVYAGTVATTNAPLPDFDNAQTDNNMFEWQVAANFEGTQTMTISVQGSPVWLTTTTSDRSVLGNIFQQQQVQSQQTVVGPSATKVVTDCLTGVTIDGQPQTRWEGPDIQWRWLIQPGQTLQATVNIPQGIIFDVWDPTKNYAANCGVATNNPFSSAIMPAGGVIYNEACYSNGVEASSAGMTPVDNPEIWFPLPIQRPWRDDIPYAIYTRVGDPTTRAVYMAIDNVPAGTPITNTAFWQKRMQNP